MPNKKTQSQPVPQLQKLAKRIPIWLYIVSLAILIIALLSRLPGGQDLTVLIYWIVGWTVSIWLVWRFKTVRKFTIGLLILLVILYFIAYFLGQAAVKLNGG